MPPYNNKKRRMEPESDGEKQVVKKAKGDKKPKKDLAKDTDAEEHPHWEIGNNRRIGSSQFKGNTLVNIREYYTAPDGELRPGKKGISLSLDQYRALLKIIPELNQELRSQGHDVGDAPAVEMSGALVKTERPAKSKKKPTKANIDATSDEEEESDAE
ncbi:transcriptional Coactivator p15-domain-containing protein [Chaetomidium leptoderma]|uniref:Transcriptional Coactivator p15-domain-containing protein n=1 Tax=Chaetomidium leptoderma TaxID=669021 RepID=A0AAN6VN17_9PEZI|nr:transcriptional Coactivator p15-domain-containing protein [Chaetomidium leptoderma]